MTNTEKQLIRDFFSCASKLLDANIVRSDKLLGDIGEWLCVKKYGLVLADSGRNPGYDGHIDGKRVQVKVHNSPKGTNLSVGNPDKYDELIVLIGPRSKLRIVSEKNSFHAYRFTSSEVEEKMRRDSGHYCARTTLEDKNHESIGV